MNATELRIGNLVWLQSHHHAVAIEEIWQGRVGETWISTDLHEGEKLDDYEPIPITEEVLLKCGFIKEVRVHTFYRVHSDNNFIIELYYDTAADGMCFMVNNIQRKKIKHLHQLQNLYFALTGTELEIEL